MHKNLMFSQGRSLWPGGPSGRAVWRLWESRALVWRHGRRGPAGKVQAQVVVGELWPDSQRVLFARKYMLVHVWPVSCPTWTNIEMNLEKYAKLVGQQGHRTEAFLRASGRKDLLWMLLVNTGQFSKVSWKQGCIFYCWTFAWRFRPPTAWPNKLMRKRTCCPGKRLVLPLLLNKKGCFHVYKCVFQSPCWAWPNWRRCAERRRDHWQKVSLLLISLSISTKFSSLSKSWTSNWTLFSTRKRHQIRHFRWSRMRRIISFEYFGFLGVRSDQGNRPTLVRSRVDRGSVVFSMIFNHCSFKFTDVSVVHARCRSWWVEFREGDRFAGIAPGVGRVICMFFVRYWTVACRRFRRQSSTGARPAFGRDLSCETSIPFFLFVYIVNYILDVRFAFNFVVRFVFLKLLGLNGIWYITYLNIWSSWERHVLSSDEPFQAARSTTFMKALELFLDASKGFGVTWLNWRV